MTAGNLIAAYRTSAHLAAAEMHHAEWNQAQVVQLTRYWSGAEAPPTRHAEARIIWSPTALCVRFVCQQDEPLIVSANPQLVQKTHGLWDRDTCEIFVTPDNVEYPQRYLEFEAAPTGEWLDLAIEHKEGVRETDWDFNSGMTAAAHITDGEVMVALCIPWMAFGREPKAGDRWRINLFRCVGADPTRGYLAWQPTYAPQPNFHVPTAFGWLEFSGEG